MKTVLVIDDEGGIADGLAAVLTDEGYFVLTARNGSQGLLRAEESRPDIILLDYMMPVLDGPQTLRALKADPRTAPIPVIMMSAMSADVVLRDCSGVAGFLRKPFELDQLFGMLRKTLGT